MCVFHLIVSNAQVNKMDAHNISVCVAPSIFHKLDRPNDVESSFKAIAFVEYLINNIDALFGEDTFSLLQQARNVTSQPTTTTINESETVDTKSRPNGTKPKTEFGGRVLNLVSLKGRKSLAPKLKSKSTTSSLSGPAPIPPSPSTNIITTTTTTTSTVNSSDLAVEQKPIVDNNNCVIVDEENLLEKLNEFQFKRVINQNAEKRRRTSTNNSVDNLSTSTQHSVAAAAAAAQPPPPPPKPQPIVAQPAVVESTKNKFLLIEQNLDDVDFDDDDDEYDENTDDDEHEDEDDEAQPNADQPANNRNVFRLKTNLRNLKSNQGRKNQHHVPATSTTQSINTNPLHQHDLSSNTLSVDSGLSVPTVTNSDLESEKSANVKQTHTSSENLSTPVESSSGTHYLKRQKRMLKLNRGEYDEDGNENENENDDDDDDEEVEEEEITDLTQTQPQGPRRSNLNLMKQFSETDAFFLDPVVKQTTTKSNNETADSSYSSLDKFFKQRNSIKSYAPLAPHLRISASNLAAAANDDEEKNNQPQQRLVDHVLVPYETNVLPLTYQKPLGATTRSVQSPIHPQKSTKIDLVVASATLSASLLNDDSQSSGKLKSRSKDLHLSSLTTASSRVASKSTLTEPPMAKSDNVIIKLNTSTQPTLQPLIHKRPHLSRKSVVKINLEKPLPIDLLYDGIQTGIGLAYNLSLNNPQFKSSALSQSINTSLSSSSSSIMI